MVYGYGPISNHTLSPLARTWKSDSPFEAQIEPWSALTTTVSFSVSRRCRRCGEMIESLGGADKTTVTTGSGAGCHDSTLLGWPVFGEVFLLTSPFIEPPRPSATPPPAEELLSKLDRICLGRCHFPEEFREFSSSIKATPPRSVQIKSISSPTEGAVVILEGAVER